MADAFLFKAQLEINKIEKLPDPRTSSKRARSFDVDVGTESIRPPVMESFKSKIDVATALNIEDVASKLKEAMKGNFAGIPLLFPMLKGSMNDVLNTGVCEEEIKDKLFSISSLKSPGPDGFPAAFF
ncbi:hypothetical protein QYF36_001908 [Acer negundo]|nr:hypothetical protein QYF36_001908 [Acer negundo]